MKHIGKTNNNEVIVCLNMVDINELLAIELGAEIYYEKEAKKGEFPKGAQLIKEDAKKWWRTLYDLRKEL